MKLLTNEFITVPTSSCHASTLVQKDGITVAAWFGGTCESHNDVQIYVARRENGNWSSPVCVSEREDIPHWNPVLFDVGEELLLFYKRGKTIAHWQTAVMQSYDKGRSWSAPVLLCAEDDGGRGPVKNKPVRLSDGSILAGASIEQGPWRAFTDQSRDNGRTWRKSALIPLPSEGTEVIQPTIWEDGTGVHLLLRSKNGCVFRADSRDGLEWGMAYPLAVPHNNSGLDLVNTPNGLILCCNPVTKGRTPLALLHSTDGLHFETVLTLENGLGEYSYPAIIWDGTLIRGTYTWKREKIVYFEAAF